MSKIGAHVSIAGGLENAPKNAAKIGCEFFQFFSKSPRGGKAKEINAKIATNFIDTCEKLGFGSWNSNIIHSAYFINLASTNNRIFHGSISSLKQELEVANLLKVPFVVTHIGSAKDFEGDSFRDLARQQVEKGLSGVLKEYTGRSQLLLEIAAGSGNIMGDSIDEIAYFLKKFPQLGFCMDTCHSFVAGYDLHTKKGVIAFFQEMEEKIGLSKLKVIHLNDSLTGLNSKVDRHAHLGEGEIGEKGLSAVIEIAKAKNIPMIIETKDEKIVADIDFAKEKRDSC
jgi:deoxyribonuclease IV